MITFFTNPRPFRGPFDALQRNALKSWLALDCACEIILFDDEEGTSAQVAREMGLKCLKPVCNANGTPLLDREFAAVRAEAAYPVLAQVNTDILLFDDFPRSVARVREQVRGGGFFMIGRRWDLDVPGPLDFSAGWQDALKARLAQSARLHGISGIDYWVFPKDVPFDPPPFNVGRPGMDSWLVYRARTLGVPVIDATADITIIHQNHDYPRKAMPFFDEEVRQNRAMGKTFMWGMTLLDADWSLRGGQVARPAFPRRLFSWLSMCYPWRLALALRRKLRS